jgi:hypothetical protein
MADQPKIYHYTEFDGTAYTSLVSAKIAAQNDTVTFSDYTSISTVQAIRKDTGAALTTSVATNVVTITSVLTNVNIFLLVWGQRT